MLPGGKDADVGSEKIRGASWAVKKIGERWEFSGERSLMRTLSVRDSYS
jgi:hypothetical protein